MAAWERGVSTVRTFRPDGSDAQWLGEKGIVSGLKYSSTRPGGDDQMSLSLLSDPVIRYPALDPGRICEIYRGAARQWWGQLGEPVQTPAGWDVNAHGAGTIGSNFVDVWSTWNLNDGINQAIARGLPWSNQISIASGYLGQKVDSGSQSITDFMNNIIQSPNQTWYISEQGNLIVTAMPTTPTRLLMATVAPGRTITADVNTIFLKYTVSSKQGGATVYGLTSVQNTDLAAKHGVVEDYFDITGNGVLSTGAAQAIGSDLLGRYQRAPFSTAFTVSYGQYTNMGGTAVDLGCESAGEVARVMVTDSPFGGEVTMGPIQFMIGQCEFDHDADQLALTPYLSYRTDLQSVLARITARRAR